MEQSAVNSDAAGVPAAPVRSAPAPPGPAPVPVLQHDQGDLRDRREAWEMALRRKRWVRWFVSWLPHELTIAIRSLLRWEHLILAKVRHRWHRSLQLRVVGTTLVISAAVIAVLGFFLTEQIADGLLYNAENTAKAQMLTALSNAQSVSGVTSAPPNGQVAYQVQG